ncbi:MAG TPA: helix-turn-helix domain-containing protein [Steroidobacteraceae bacterium]|nr:helix-turn-helix domain-containing protein [Steroidobacteraceae bacterium]
MNIIPPGPADLGEPKVAALLEAAVGVFARFGYRKASMDDVARAAGVSRQGLYLLFANKEELFRRAVAHCLRNQLAAAIGALSRGEDSLEVRLIAACVEWSGRFVGSAGTDAGDLMCASTSLAGATLGEYRWQFEEALASAIAASPLADVCAAADVGTEDLARALHATAQGLKQSCKSREAFVKGMTAAVRMICRPPNQRGQFQGCHR